MTVRPCRSAALSVLLLVAAGCGSSSADTKSSAPTAAGSTVVATRKVPGYGAVLATKSGRPLYVLSSDPAGGSKCTGSCATQWPPLVGDGKPAAAEGVDGSKLDTFTREDGATQVLYNMHALYTYTGEGLTGIGTKALGGSWYLVSPSGEPIKTTKTGVY